LVSAPPHVVKIDYRNPEPKRTNRQLWIGIALWIVIAIVLTGLVWSLCARSNDPNTWR